MRYGLYTTSVTSVSSPGESDLGGCGQRLVCEDRRVRVLALRGLRPGRTDFLILYCGCERVW